MSYGYNSNSNQGDQGFFDGNFGGNYDPFSALDEFYGGAGSPSLPPEGGQTPNLFGQFGSALASDMNQAVERERASRAQQENALGFLMDQGYFGAMEDADAFRNRGTDIADFTGNMRFGFAEDAADAQRAALDDFISDSQTLPQQYREASRGLTDRADEMVFDQDMFAETVRDDVMDRIAMQEEKTTKDYEEARRLAKDAIEENRKTQELVLNKSRMHEMAVKRSLDKRLDEESAMVLSDPNLTPDQQRDMLNQAKQQHATGTYEVIGRLENARIEAMTQVGAMVSRGLEIGANTFKSIGDALNARATNDLALINQANSLAGQLRQGARSTAAGLYNSAGNLTAQGLQIQNQINSQIMGAKMNIESSLANNHAVTASNWERTMLGVEQQAMAAEQVARQGLPNIAKMMANMSLPTMQASKMITQMLQFYASTKAAGIDPNSTNAINYKAFTSGDPMAYDIFGAANKNFLEESFAGQGRALFPGRRGDLEYAPRFLSEGVYRR